jgi:hypothetical protein
MAINKNSVLPSLSNPDYLWILNTWGKFSPLTDAYVDTPTSLSSFNLIVWAEGEKIGCGQVVCNVSGKYYFNFLCEYAGPYQMLLFDSLWLRGAPGSACPDGRIPNADGNNKIN